MSTSICGIRVNVRMSNITCTVRSTLSAQHQPTEWTVALPTGEAESQIAGHAV